MLNHHAFVLLDLGTGGDQVRRLETRVFVGKADKGGFRVEMQKIGVERGLSWNEAYTLYKEHNSDEVRQQFVFWYISSF